MIKQVSLDLNQENSIFYNFTLVKFAGWAKSRTFVSCFS